MKRLTKLALLTPLAAALLPGVVFADASSEISALRDRLEQLEAQVAQQKSAAPAAVAKPGSASSLQIGNTNFSFGGYIRIDALYSSYSDGEQANVVARDIHLPSQTPVFNTTAGATNAANVTGKRSSVLDAHAKTTRFNVKTSTDAGNGQKIGGFIEFDFLTGGSGTEVATNRYEPTLRHAFITYDKWLIGQTWTTFQDLGAFPDTVEFVGATDGTVFGRQPQVRYTNGSFQVALENPQSFLGAAGPATNNDSSLPDVVARYTHKADFGHVSVAALGRQLKDKNAASGADTAFGGGISVSGKVKLSSHDDIRFMATHGTGIGRYVALGLIGDAKLDANGEIETNDVTAAYVTYHHMWNDKWRSNLQVSGLTADYENGLESPTDTESNVSGLVNVIYTVAPKFDIGFEYLRSERKLNNGDKGSLDRVQGMAKYSF